MLVHDYEAIANDPEVDIVVEVMGGVEPAYTFTKCALEVGKSACTSNRAMADTVPSLQLQKSTAQKFICLRQAVRRYPDHPSVKLLPTADEIDEATASKWYHELYLAKWQAIIPISWMY